MAITQTEILGFNSKVVAAITENAAACAAEGLDVSTWGADQTALAKTASDADALQEKMKLDLTAQTTATDAAFQAVYSKGSSRLDAMAGAVGKTTPLGKSLLNLRSSIRSGAQAAPTPTPPAPPTP